jgi:hypothetical protein
MRKQREQKQLEKSVSGDTDEPATEGRVRSERAAAAAARRLIQQMAGQPEAVEFVPEACNEGTRQVWQDSEIEWTSTEVLVDYHSFSTSATEDEMSSAQGAQDSLVLPEHCCFHEVLSFLLWYCQLQGADVSG